MDFEAPHAHSYRPLIINVALTGIVPAKVKYPNLPVTPEEIGKDVHTCFELGARVFHLHMRDKNDGPVQDSGLFAETIGIIREQTPEAIVCVTTSSRASVSFEDRVAPLLLAGELRPEFGSLTAGSFNFPNSVSTNSPDDIKVLLQTPANMTLMGYKTGVRRIIKLCPKENQSLQNRPRSDEHLLQKFPN